MAIVFTNLLISPQQSVTPAPLLILIIPPPVPADPLGPGRQLGQQGVPRGIKTTQCVTLSSSIVLDKGWEVEGHAPLQEQTPHAVLQGLQQAPGGGLVQRHVSQR